MFQLAVNFITAYLLGYYLITVLQWYNYKIKRIVFNFHKPLWHFIYLIIPILTYIAAYKFFWIYLFFGLVPAIVFWSRRTKGLKVTKRVKRFFLILGLIETVNLLLIYKYKINPGIGVSAVLILSVGISEIVEYILFLKYKKNAKEKLKKINPTVVAITASYGKTSIKNFLYQLLKDDFKVYKTPRSVNTIKGIVLDINTSLPSDTKIYITEAGARERGDIKEIVKFLENEYSILGKTGPQHMEYFKNLENIKKTKLEIFESPRLKKGFSYEEVDNDKVVAVKDKIKNIHSNLEGVRWELEINGKIHCFYAPVLGEFNAINISLAVFQALEFIKDIEKIKSKVLKLNSIPHRLQKTEAGGKIIIDDSFNGNIEGMLKSFELVKTYKGRKIIVTPGIVEGTKEMNEKIAKKISQVFDIAIITGESNRKVLCSNITVEKIIVKDKKNLEKILADITKRGDLILFSNDFPEYL